MSIESRSRQYGKVFDHWQIKEILGSGSGGKTAVFRLQRIDSSWGVCALKIVNLIEERGNMEELSDARQADYQAAQEECSRSAEQEVRLMDELRGNTNIVDYLDHAFVDWSEADCFGRDLLIRMELLRDLRSELRNGRIFKEAEILKIGHDICTALVRCHNKNILHRDVKPENIFRNKDGDYKLGDFGVSRVLDACPGAVASTGIGTYEYWPAEQMTGSYDKRVDIYSLGLVLYELSNRNRLPFAASTYVTGKEVSLRLSGVPMPEPTEASQALARVIMKACAFKPEDRYQSAEEFLKALDWVSRKSQASTNISTTGFSEQNVPSVRFETVPARPSDTPKPVFETQPAQSWESETQPARPGKNNGRSYLKKQNKEKKKRWLPVLLAVLLLCAAAGVFAGAKVWMLIQYFSAKALLEADKYDQAITAFEALGDYQDSPEQMESARLAADYAAAENLAQSGKTSKAAMAFYALGEKERSFELWEQATSRETVSTGWGHTVGLKTDGTVVAAGTNDYGQCDISDWTDIVAVGAGYDHTVGLKSDGTVVAVGGNSYGQCDVEDWRDIVAIDAGLCYSVGLMADGTAVAVGWNGSEQCNVGDWTDIIAISAGAYHTVGLKSDGTVIAVGNNTHGQWNVGGWTDIVAVGAGTGSVHTVGLKSDGTVVAVGDRSGQCNVGDWRNVVAVSAGGIHTVGLKSDGTVVAAGSNNSGQCNVGDWRKVVAVSAGLNCTVGLKADGTLVTAGYDRSVQLDIQDWTGIMLPYSRHG